MTGYNNENGIVKMDNQAMVSIIDRSYLNDIQPCKPIWITSLAGKTKYTEDGIFGNLPFRVYAGNKGTPNILSQDAMEKCFSIKYVKGQYYQVFDKEVSYIFRKNNRVYISQIDYFINQVNLNITELISNSNQL